MTKYSISSYTADGTTTDFLLTWDYLDKTHITVYVDAVNVADAGSGFTSTLINSTTVRVTTDLGAAVPAGKIVELRRETPIDTQAVTFNDGSSLNGGDLNTNTDYLLYAMQETIDTIDIAAQDGAAVASAAAAASAAEAEGFKAGAETAETNAAAFANAAATYRDEAQTAKTQAEAAAASLNIDQNVSTTGTPSFSSVTAGQVNSSGAVIAAGAGQFGDDVAVAGDLGVTGNVGIGTSSPSYPLDIASSSGSGATLHLYNNGNGGSTNGVVTAFSADSNGSRVGFGNNAFPSAQYSFDVSRIDTSKSGWAWSSFVLNSTYQSQSAMTLQYVDASGSQAERLRIDSSGNVGIGTTSPSSKLHVNGDSTFGGAITEGVYNLTGTALDPSNGTIQTKTLSANTTFTDSLSAGESITLMIDDGSAHTITWPTMTWVNNAGAAPTLATTGYTVVALWKVGSTLYGALVGDGS